MKLTRRSKGEEKAELGGIYIKCLPQGAPYSNRRAEAAALTGDRSRDLLCFPKGAVIQISLGNVGQLCKELPHTLQRAPLQCHSLRMGVCWRMLRLSAWNWGWYPDLITDRNSWLLLVNPSPSFLPWAKRKRGAEWYSEVSAWNGLVPSPNLRKKLLVAPTSSLKANYWLFLIVYFTILL